MASFKPGWLRFTACCSAIYGTWLVLGLFLFHQAADRNNAMLLDELSEQLIRFTEKAVDFVVTANTELLVAGQTGCGAEALSTLKQLLLSRGSVAELYLISPTESCSVFGEFAAELPPFEIRSKWLEASNPAYRLGSIDNLNNRFLAVSWGFGTSFELVTLINPDPVLFGILPNELRSHGRVLLLAGEQLVAEFDGIGPGEASLTRGTEFQAFGSRYPLKTVISIDKTALTTWRKNMPTAIVLVWFTIGIIVSGSISLSLSARHASSTKEIEEALNNSHIVPYYQPIISLESGRIIGCEALARWERTDGTLVSPDNFVPLIEQNELDWRLFTCLLDQVVTHISQFLDVSAEFYVGFNVTPKQLTDPQFSELLADEVRDRTEPCSVCIEVTERQAISSLKIASENTARLKRKGFKVAIDDAGTGHNGLASMQALSADVIKIDKFFIDHIDDDPRSRIMVDMLVNIARRYGMQTIAEGVETDSQRQVLADAGINGAQGFLFSKPLPYKAFLEQLAAHESAVNARMHHDNGDQIQQPLIAQLP